MILDRADFTDWLRTQALDAVVGWGTHPTDGVLARYLAARGGAASLVLDDRYRPDWVTAYRPLPAWASGFQDMLLPVLDQPITARKALSVLATVPEESPV